MFSVKSLPKAKLEQVTTDNGRYYVKEDGTRFPSVTTILKNAYDQTWLREWIDRVGEEEAARISKAAAERGTMIHDKMERYLLGETVSDKDVSVFFRKNLRELRQRLDANVSVVYGTEMACYSERLNAAGTFDLCCKWKGKDAILDYKTSTHEKRKEQIPHYFVQATAYSEMLKEMYGMKIETIVIAVVYEMELPRFFEVSPEEYLNEVERIFVTERV